MYLYGAEDYIGKERDRAKSSEDPEDVLLPPGCLNSGPISDLKMSFSTPGEAEITMSSLDRLRIARTANVRFKLRNV